MPAWRLACLLDLWLGSGANASVETKALTTTTATTTNTEATRAEQTLSVL